MVILKNLSAYPGEPPREGDHRKIPGGPLYPLSEVQVLASQSGALNLWTLRCRNTAAGQGLDTGDVGTLIGELTERDYRDSEWCENGRGACAACDAYSLRRLEFMEKVGKSFTVEYFLKFAVAKTGQLLLIVSCHT